MQNKEIEEAKKSLEKFAYTIHGTFSVGEAKRILKYIDQLETKVKELGKENNKLNRANKTYINSLQSITPVLLQDYIEKQVIKDKIRELKFIPLQDKEERQKINCQIDILQELLEEK